MTTKMTDEEIFERAMEKAELVLNPKIKKTIMENDNYYIIIFSHSFAKAFWGEHKEDGLEDGYCRSCQKRFLGLGRTRLSCWKVHLQNMVLEENPISYLGRFL